MRLFPPFGAGLMFGLVLTSCGLGTPSAAAPQTAKPAGPDSRTRPAAMLPAAALIESVPSEAPAQRAALPETPPSPLLSPSPRASATPVPDRWVQTFLPAPLLSGPNPRAKQFSVLPPFSYLRVLRQAGDYFYVLNPATNGPAYVAANRVGPSGPPPPPLPFQPFWVQNFRTTQLWSSPTANAASFGTLPAWHFFHAIAPAAGSRLLVTVDRGDQIAYVDRSDVGPSGPPTAAVPGFLDIAAGG
ncbi:MAG: hypothetical protein KGJ86_10365, partial [Chloroflexota bacterium]|nr:hypothetical protein [Chloroflexota bacterium]